ncbi:MAG TPA: hypothetical protein VK726_11565 [Acetobacteraceae bacterium]|jgi:hypothetical protein|nr:hypothetical protein [Acetobacteraceae bacterium]
MVEGRATRQTYVQPGDDHHLRAAPLREKSAYVVDFADISPR